MTARSFFLCAALLSGSQPAFAAAPSNDRVNRATTVSSLPFQDVLNTSAATTSMNDPVCVGQGPTVWFRISSIAGRPSDCQHVRQRLRHDAVCLHGHVRGRMLTEIACNDDYESLEFSRRVLPGERWASRIT